MGAVRVFMRAASSMYVNVEDQDKLKSKLERQKKKKTYFNIIM